MALRMQRSNIYRRRAQGVRPAWRALAGVVVGVLVAVLIYLAETSGKGIPFASYRTVNVSVPNIGHLQQHDPVEIAGVYVGQVESVSTAHNKPLVKLQLSGVGPLPVDTRAVVRGYGLLGARYMEVDPGSSARMLPNGATITELSEQSSYTWGIPDALNLFDPKTRAALGNMWRGFGAGLEGRGQQLNSAIHIGPGSGADFDQAAYAILARTGAPQSFFPDQNSGWTALNGTGNAIPAAFPSESTTARAFVEERNATEALLQGFPAAERGIDAGFSPTVGLPFLGSAAHLADTLRPVLPALPHALRSAVTFLRDTQQPLRSTLPAVDEVPQAVPPTLRILAAVRPDLAPLKQGLTNLVPTVSNLAEHGCDIQNWATGTLGLTSLGTNPGGNWGPDIGFPVGVILQPNGYLDSYVNTRHSPFLSTSGYYPPCAYSPGPVINSSQFMSILGNLVKGAL